jgi:hypothetical protein
MNIASSSSIEKELKEKISAYVSLSRGIIRPKELNTQLLMNKWEITSLLEELFRNSITDDYYFLIVLWLFIKTAFN